MTRVPGARAWGDVRAWDRSVDPRLAAGRLAAALFLLAGITLICTVGFLPAHVDRTAVLATTIVVFATVVVLLLLPWPRMPRWTTLLPHVWGQVLIGGALG